MIKMHPFNDQQQRKNFETISHGSRMIADREKKIYQDEFCHSCGLILEEAILVGEYEDCPCGIGMKKRNDNGYRFKRTKTP